MIQDLLELAGWLAGTGPEPRLASVEWERFYRAAASHGLAGGMHRLSSLPAAYRERARTDYLGQTARATMALHQWAEIRHGCREHSLRVVPLKGLALLEDTYQPSGERMIGDLDLLVTAQDSDRVLELLSSLGYRKCPAYTSADEEAAQRRLSHACPVIRPGSLPVEIHTCWLKDGRSADLDDIAVGDGLRREALLAHVAIHADGHHRLGTGKLKWWVDLARLLSSRESPELVPAAARLAKACGRSSSYSRAVGTVTRHWLPALRAPGSWEPGYAGVELAGCGYPLWKSASHRLATRLREAAALPVHRRPAYAWGLFAPTADHLLWRYGGDAAGSRTLRRLHPWRMLRRDAGERL